MTIESFVKHYNLHDSYITSVEYSVDSHCVLLFIDPDIERILRYDTEIDR